MTGIAAQAPSKIGHGGRPIEFGVSVVEQDDVLVERMT
jgi:hypothetical protein